MNIGSVEEVTIDQLVEKGAEIAERNEVAKKEESPFGTRYVIDGIFKAADGRDFQVRTVWFIDNESQIPHFITAYPKKGK